MELTSQQIVGMPIAAWLILQGLVVRLMERGILTYQDIIDLTHPLASVLEQVAIASPDQAKIVESASQNIAQFLQTLDSLHARSLN